MANGRRGFGETVYRSLGQARTSAQRKRGQRRKIVQPAHGECVGGQCRDACKVELTANIPRPYRVSWAEPAGEGQVPDMRIDRNASGEQVLREGVVPFGR